MNGTRILRYVGNREEPEKELFGVEEVIHGHQIAFTPLSEFARMALPVTGLAGIKPLSFDEKSKMTQLVESVTLPHLDFGGIYSQIVGMGFLPSPSLYEEKEEPKPPEPEFEVNMVEPLVGWRSWNLHEGLLVALRSGKRWFPEKAVEAEHDGLHHHTGVPRENCSCGIYAVNHLGSVPDGQVYGEVYGWGRYVRGDNGWRAQFAYPKCFYLAQNQPDLIDCLKKYHVPIYIETPVKVFSPEEDGYDEYRPNEAHGDSGAVEDSSPDQDDYEEDDD